MARGAFVAANGAVEKKQEKDRKTAGFPSSGGAPGGVEERRPEEIAMTLEPDTQIRRRPDGSIDIEFYARLAASLRGRALREEPARWLSSLGRAIARLAAAISTPRAPASSRRSR